MDFGIALATPANAWETVKRAEELGFSHAWFYDTPVLSGDCFVAMGAAAAKTSRIRLGTGVLIPSNRLAPVTANAFATLNALAPGRIDFGVGTGFTGRRTLGMGAMKLADMEEYIRVVMGLLNEETLEAKLEGERRRIRFLNPDAGCINTVDPITLHVSAYGPRGRRITAEMGAHWLTFTSDLATATAQLSDMQKSWTDAGRAADELYATHFGVGCVLGEGEPAGSERAIRQAGPRAAVQLHRAYDEAMLGLPNAGRLPESLLELRARYLEAAANFEPQERDRYLVIHRGHLMFVRPEERPFITAELIRHTSWTASEKELIDRIGNLRDAGYSQFTVQLVPGEEDAIEDWARIKAAFG
jgi:5,10-methylenetetrahydromethanopterin reductase